jgi:hypothetical protein
MACTTVLLGVNVVVLDAVPSPVHDDLRTAETLTVGALAVGLGVAFALGTAFNAGQSGPRHRKDDGQAAPNGIPPWAAEGMRTRPPTTAPDPARPVEGPATVTQVDMDPVANTREIVFGSREQRIADAWRRTDATGEQPVVPNADTHLMQFGELAALLAEPEPGEAETPPSQRDYPEPDPLWTPPAAPAAPWSPLGLAFMAVEDVDPYATRHAAARAADPGDWFGMFVEAQSERAA